MLKVHHLNNSRSQRVLWLLEELGLPYELVLYERDKKTLYAPESLKKVHALGKSPVLSDGENTIAESGAILEYIVERHGQGRFVPKTGTPEHLRYRYWMHYAEGSAMSPLLIKLIFDRIETTKMPFFVKPIAKEISRKVKKAFINPSLETHVSFQEAELGKSEWFAGQDFTVADIQMSYPVEAALERGVTGDARPKLRSFVERIRARPAYQRALERGGPYVLND